MSQQIRVDDSAYDELNQLQDELGGSRVGIASEALRIGMSELRERNQATSDNDR